MHPYLTVTCRLPAMAEEQLTTALERWPVLGCQVENAGADVDVTVFMESRQAGAVPGVCEGLRALGGREVAAAHFAEQDWLAEYRRVATPLAIGERFWVDPHPHAPTPAPDGAIHLIVEPRQAFGSGSHESTQLALLLLAGMKVAGRRVLDVGTGSGILSLAARALGASRVVGFDIDMEATFVARQTVAAQRRPLPVALYAGTVTALRERASFDLILANLIPAESEPLLPALRTLLATDGRLVLSGLMADQRTATEEELAAAAFGVDSARELQEWVALVCSPRDRRASSEVLRNAAKRPGARGA
ncbi:MAG TPA: 50S ribosomal protein L11 methyltransferase [Thermoanaerobaculaceae bacterium]|nr:50S ribosomal protein L11 methyltransferase [Thermoanaerobaculaceae bacterium]